MMLPCRHGAGREGSLKLHTTVSRSPSVQEQFERLSARVRWPSCTSRPFVLEDTRSIDSTLALS
jgi:hypothetical protein